MTTDHQGEVRWRVFVAGPNLMAEDWVPKTNPMRQPAAHHELVQAAHDADLVWLVEMFDPELPEAEAYYRIGTDPAGMVEPRVLLLDPTMVDLPGQGPN